MSEVKFAEGLMVKRHENAPDFVLCNLSIKEAEFAATMAANANNNGWINIDIKRSKKGKLYAEINNWKPNKEEPAEQSEAQPEESFEDVPF